MSVMYAGTKCTLRAHVPIGREWHAFGMLGRASGLAPSVTPRAHFHHANQSPVIPGVSGLSLSVEAHQRALLDAGSNRVGLAGLSALRCSVSSQGRHTEVRAGRQL